MIVFGVIYMLKNASNDEITSFHHTVYQNVCKGEQGNKMPFVVKNVYYYGLPRGPDLLIIKL